MKSVAFWSKVDRSGGCDACWQWVGKKDKRGYGKVCIGCKDVLTHRLAYILTKGSIPKEMVICHTCDNPPCCNPKHLSAGTHKDNVADAIAKGRMRRNATQLAIGAYTRIPQDIATYTISNDDAVKVIVGNDNMMYVLVTPFITPAEYPATYPMLWLDESEFYTMGDINLQRG